MKRILTIAVVALTVISAATAWAETPQCSSSTARGKTCELPSGKDVLACGDGTFIPVGSPISACDASWITKYDADGNVVQIAKATPEKSR